MLAKFRAAKAAEIKGLKEIFDKGLMPDPVPANQKPAFADALKHTGNIAIIAEYKRASPSLGVIRADLEIEDVAKEYESGGAAAISVLTEERYFDGRLAYLNRARKTCALPLLRKDFIFDELQIIATAATQASAVLLIARTMPNSTLLRKMRELAESYGLDAVIEIFDAHDLDMARGAGARIIQVNARDLQNLQTDTSRHLQLIEAGKPHGDEIWIAASGLSAPAHLGKAHEAGYQAALVGSSLMAKGSPGANLENLRGPHR